MDALASALADLQRRGIRPKYMYTIPTVQNPTGTIMGEARRAELLALSRHYRVPIFEDECYSDLVWTDGRPRALYAMAGGEGARDVCAYVCWTRPIPADTSRTVHSVTPVVAVALKAM